MPGPFIFVGKHSLKEGVAEDYRMYFQNKVVDLAEKNERLIGFNLYFDESGTKATLVQVHPDENSMKAHMGLIGPHLAEAYEQYIEATDGIEIYGTIGRDLLEQIQGATPPGVPVTVVPDHGGGFTRSSAAS